MNTSSGSTISGSQIKRFSPEEFFDFEGLAALVPLDYGSRYEHSVIVVPKYWDSLYHMFASPEEMLERVRKNYSDGITEPSGSPAPEIWDKNWEFKSPMEISINPLSMQGPLTQMVLEALSSFYKGSHCQPVAVAHICPEDEAKVKDSVRGGVLPKSNTVKSFHELAMTMNDYSPKEFADLLAQSAALPTTPGGFPLQYVAEFALDTGILNILYVPRKELTVHAPSDIKYFETNNITQMTFSPIHNSGASLVHFDLDFNDCDHTYADVAYRRAAVAFDFINDRKAFIARILDKMNKHANKKFTVPGWNMPDDFTGDVKNSDTQFAEHTRKTIVQSDAPSSSSANVSHGTNALPHPSGIIERVWPSLAATEMQAKQIDVVNAQTQKSTATTQSQTPVPPPPLEPPPYPCVVMMYVNGEWIWVQVKSYNG